MKLITKVYVPTLPDINHYRYHQVHVSIPPTCT